MIRKLARWGLFLLVQLLLAAVLVEGGLRLARPFHDGLEVLLYSPTVRTEYDEVQTTEELLGRSVLGFHPYRAFSGFVLNSRGFRTPEYTGEGLPGGLRAVVLGDSFTFDSSSVPWSLCWHAVMEARLRELVEPEVEVFSLGVPAVGPRFELRLWELEGGRIEPELVVLAFFVGNDFTDESGTPLAHTPEEALARWSYTVRLARNLTRLHRQRRAAGAAWPAPPAGGRFDHGGFELPAYRARYDPEKPWFTEEPFLVLEAARLRICRRSLRSEFEELFAATEQVLIRLHRSVRSSGADLAVMIIPDEVQVSDELLARVLEAHRIPAGDVELDYPQRRLAELFEAEGIPNLDLLPELRRRSREARLYKPRDTHWNADGNVVAGELMAEFLADAGLPRGSRRKKSAGK